MDGLNRWIDKYYLLKTIMAQFSLFLFYRERYKNKIDRQIDITKKERYDIMIWLEELNHNRWIR